MMSHDGDQNANPAEPVPDFATTAEPPQPPEPLDPDVVVERVEETLEADPEEEHEEELEENEGSQTSANYDRPAEDTLVEEITRSSVSTTDTSRPNSSGNRPLHEDRFAQTFVKYTKNLSIRRLVEVLNTPVDHEDDTLVFYCTSRDLLRSFEDGVRERK